jgi:putative hydrolase
VSGFLENAGLAERLAEVAGLLEEQGADRFRVAAWRRAAETVRHWPRSLAEIHTTGGTAGLQALPGVGETIARALATLLTYGRLPMLDRLRGESDPVAILASVPGIGQRLAHRFHDDLGIDTLEELEVAAWDGRLETVAGIGGKRLAGIRSALAQRLGRLRAPAPATPPPPVEELLDVDREYRERAERGELPTIAPRRFNPTGEAWLPVLHTRRGDRHYTALYSNTPRAHELGRTRDWVVLYDDDGRRERPWTVVTSRRGPLGGLRVVAGREEECRAHHEAGPLQAKARAVRGSPGRPKSVSK